MAKEYKKGIGRRGRFTVLEEPAGSAPASTLENQSMMIYY